MNMMILDKRNEAERKSNPRDSTVKTFFPGDKEPRIISFPDYIKRCRCDSVIYGCRFVGEGEEEQIDSLMDLIENYCFNRLER